MIKPNPQRTAWIVIGVILLIVAISLVVLRMNNPTLKTSTIGGWAIAGIVGASLVGYGAYYFLSDDKKPKSASDIPDPLTFAQARALAQDALKDPTYYDILDMDTVTEESVQEMGKPPCSIYLVKAKGKHCPKNNYAIGINMNYPEKRFFLINSSSGHIMSRVERLAAFPVEAPKIEEVITTNEGLGIQTVARKELPRENKEEKADAMDEGEKKEVPEEKK